MPKFTFWGRRTNRHRALLEYWQLQGSLYAPDRDDADALAIREACEELGVPMGYGRVGKPPAVLAELYWPSFHDPLDRL